jgi:hypothetical protein
MFSFILFFLFMLADSGGRLIVYLRKNKISFYFLSKDLLASNSITTVNYLPKEQCFKGGQEGGRGPFRLNFRQNGSGFCE